MSFPADTTALILAGGKGTRLRDAVPDRPKVLAEVGGRPFLTFILDRLADVGIARTVLCTGFLADAVEDCLGARWRSMELAYSVETEPLGTGGALRNAMQLVETDQVLVLNGDSYCEADLGLFARSCEDLRAKSALLVARVPETSRFGTVGIDEFSRVTTFVEKCGAGGPGTINAGVYLFASDVVRAFPDRRPLSLEREILPRLDRLVGRACAGSFIDIGTPESWASAEAFFEKLEQVVVT